MRGEVVDNQDSNVIIKCTILEMDERTSDINGSNVLVRDGIVMTTQEHSPVNTNTVSLVTAALSDEHDISASDYQESSASELSGYQSIIYVNSDGQVTIPGDQNLLLDSDSHAASLHLDHGDFTLSASDENTDIGQSEQSTVLTPGSSIDQSKVINIVPSAIRLTDTQSVAVTGK